MFPKNAGKLSIIVAALLLAVLMSFGGTVEKASAQGPYGENPLNPAGWQELPTGYGEGMEPRGYIQWGAPYYGNDNQMYRAYRYWGREPYLPYGIVPGSGPHIWTYDRPNFHCSYHCTTEMLYDFRGPGGFYSVVGRYAGADHHVQPYFGPGPRW